MNKLDIYIFKRLSIITAFVLVVLLFIFIIIDFSDNSDDFADRGATIAEVWGQYYLNYIPEMIRLVIPVAVFTACLFLTGQLAERLEINSLYAAGVSMYRLMVPYLVFGIMSAGIISALDAYTIPHSNSIRIEFEKKYIKRKTANIDKGNLFRQLGPDNILKVNFFQSDTNKAFYVWLENYENGRLARQIHARNMIWVDSTEQWRLSEVTDKVFSENTYRERSLSSLDTTLTVVPADLGRTTSDIYQLSYPEAIKYIESIERSGAGGIDFPKVQFYGRLVYPLSMIIVLIIGFALASTSNKNAKGFNIAMGLTISFLYLAFMKIAEPFGHTGTLTPEFAAALPHAFFFIVGIMLVIKARK